MYCPNCGSNNHESKACSHRGGNHDELSRVDSAADERSRALRKQYRSGRRGTIVGALFLLSAGLILLGLVSKDLPPFLAFLWTCWIFLGGVITIAEGVAKQLSSNRLLQELACANSRDRNMAEDRPDQGGERPGQPASTASDAENGSPIDGHVSALLDKDEVRGEVGLTEFGR